MGSELDVHIGAYLKLTVEEEGVCYWDLIEGYDEYEDELIHILPDESLEIFLAGNKWNKNKPDALYAEQGEVLLTADMVDQYKQNFIQNYKKIIALIEPQVVKSEIRFGIIIS